MVRTVKTVCSHDCPDACSVLISVEGDGSAVLDPARVESARVESARVESAGVESAGVESAGVESAGVESAGVESAGVESAGAPRAIQFRGDPDHPFTRGFLCGKVNTYEQVVYSPDRLLHPLARSGPKGSGRFERVSWDDALARIAGEIERTIARSGGEAIHQYYYAGTMGIVHRFSADALFHRLGASRQITNICYFGADAGYHAVVGSGYGVDPEDCVHSDLIVIWGCNVVTTQVHLVPIFDEARRRGAKLIVIDPYRNRTAKIADEWISIEPGTDTALALALMHVIERDDLADREFIAGRTSGYERLADGVLPRFAPSRAAEITGVPEATIIDLAHRIGRARAPLFKVGIGLGRSSHGASAVRSVCCLAGQVGAWRERGGGVLYDSGCEFRFDLDPLKRPDWLEKPTRVIRQTDLGPALTELDDPPIEILYVHGANPMATVPMQETVRRGLEREDLFTIVHDRFMTDTARLADIVLPAVTFAESEDLYKSYGHLYLQYGRRAIPPRGECRSNLDVIQALGKALGFSDPWFETSVEEFARRILAASVHPNFATVDVEQLLSGAPCRLDLPRGESGFREAFGTASGKLEFYSEKLDSSHGFGVVDFRGDPFNTDPARFPLRLLTPPAHSFLNSSFGELEKARRREGGRPRILVHPRDAAGVASGEEAVLENDLGALRVVALVTEDTRPGTVVAEGTWWPMWNGDGRGINTLTSNRLTEFGEGSTFHDNRVRLRRAGDNGAAPAR